VEVLEDDPVSPLSEGSQDLCIEEIDDGREGGQSGRASPVVVGAGASNNADNGVQGKTAPIVKKKKVEMKPMAQWTEVELLRNVMLRERQGFCCCFCSNFEA